MGVVVDSSVFISFERLERAFEPSTIGIDEGHIALAAVTASELLVGIFRADTARRRGVRESIVEPILSNLQSAGI